VTKSAARRERKGEKTSFLRGEARRNAKGAILAQGGGVIMRHLKKERKVSQSIKRRSRRKRIRGKDEVVKKRKTQKIRERLGTLGIL